jgi:hypothetical protein
MSSYNCNQITRKIQDSVSAGPEFMNHPGEIRIRAHLFKKLKNIQADSTGCINRREGHYSIDGERFFL